MEMINFDSLILLTFFVDLNDHLLPIINEHQIHSIEDYALL